MKKTVNIQRNEGSTVTDPLPETELKRAVIAYLSEFDNPVPDYNYRRVLRNRMRELAGAPPEWRPK